MLDLDAFVNLEEIIVALVIGHELHRSRIHVAGLMRNTQGGLTHLLPEIRHLGHQRRRRFLNQLLIAALDGAIAFAEMNDVAFGVAQNLVLNMARVLDEFLDVHPAIAESFLRLRARGVKAL